MDPNAHMRILLSHYDRGNIADETGGMVKVPNEVQPNPPTILPCIFWSNSGQVSPWKPKRTAELSIWHPCQLFRIHWSGENREEILTEQKSLPVHIIMSILSTSTVYTASTKLHIFHNKSTGYLWYFRTFQSVQHNGTTTMNEDVSPIKNHRRLSSTWRIIPGLVSGMKITPPFISNLIVTSFGRGSHNPT